MYSVLQTWPEGTVPPVSEFTRWIKALPFGEAQDVLQRMLESSAEASRCFQENHQGRLEYLEQRHAHLLRLESELQRIMCKYDDPLDQSTLIIDAATEYCRAATERAEADLKADVESQRERIVAQRDEIDWLRRFIADAGLTLPS